MEKHTENHKLLIAQSVKRHWDSIRNSLDYIQRCEKMSKNRKGISSFNKGMKLTEETKRKISLSKKGNIPWNKGKKGIMPTPWNKGKHTRNGRYIQVTINGKRIYEHHYIYCVEHGIKEIPKGYEVHHINKNCSDNRIENLILLSKEEHRGKHGYRGY